VRCPEALAGRFRRSRQGLPGVLGGLAGFRRSRLPPGSQVSGPRVLGCPWCPWCPWMWRAGSGGGAAGTVAMWHSYGY